MMACSGSMTMAALRVNEAQGELSSHISNEGVEDSGTQPTAGNYIEVHAALKLQSRSIVCVLLPL